MKVDVCRVKWVEVSWFYFVFILFYYKNLMGKKERVKEDVFLLGW